MDGRVDGWVGDWGWMDGRTEVLGEVTPTGIPT